MVIITVSILLVMFAFDVWLTILNYQNRKQPIPANVSDIYDQPSYEKWLSYLMSNTKLSIITKSTNIVATLIFLLVLAPIISKQSSTFTTSLLVETILFLGSYMLYSLIINIGFDIYDTFVIEEKFGFNTTSKATFIADQVKNLILTSLIGILLLSGLIWLLEQFQTQFVLYAWIMLTVFVLLLNMLYTKLLVPLFNKLTPLEQGPLKEKIEAFISQTGYNISKISVMNASKRSNRLNAYFSGFGKFKHVVLFDTLINKLSDEEIISVLAHEIGHAKNKDVIRNTLRSVALLGIYLWLFAWFLGFEQLPVAFDLPANHLGFSLVLFFIYLQPVGLLIGMLSSTISKKAEYKADAYVKQHGYHHFLVSALKILSRENFSNLTPHPLVVALTYSHPPVSFRIKALLD